MGQNSTLYDWQHEPIRRCLLGLWPAAGSTWFRHDYCRSSGLPISPNPGLDWRRNRERQVVPLDVKGDTTVPFAHAKVGELGPRL